jgi:hypothetical protein
VINHILEDRDSSLSVLWFVHVEIDFIQIERHKRNLLFVKVNTMEARTVSEVRTSV